MRVGQRCHDVCCVWVGGGEQDVDLVCGFCVVFGGVAVVLFVVYEHVLDVGVEERVVCWEVCAVWIFEYDVDVFGFEVFYDRVDCAYYYLCIFFGLVCRDWLSLLAPGYYGFGCNRDVREFELGFVVGVDRVVELDDLVAVGVLAL